jgi:hypothetical protein
MGHPGTTKPAPTPVNQLGPLFERQQKYHPARPYRWWQFRPTPPEAPEVFYPRIESLEEYTARHRRPPGFWEHVSEGILALVLWLLVGGYLYLLFNSFE